MVSVSASVNLPLHHKVQKFSSGTGSPGWSRKKGRNTVMSVSQPQPSLTIIHWLILKNKNLKRPHHNSRDYVCHDDPRRHNSDRGRGHARARGLDHGLAHGRGHDLVLFCRRTIYRARVFVLCHNLADTCSTISVSILGMRRILTYSQWHKQLEQWSQLEENVAPYSCT